LEGFVNQYVEEPSGTGSAVVFSTEAIENIPVHAALVSQA
jgi:hypothetical protein